MAFYQHYRVSSVGLQLEDSLDDLLDAEALTEDLADVVRLQFDKAISAALTSWVKNKASLKGGLRHYRNCDNVWTFFLEDAVLKLEGTGGNDPEVACTELKIIACDGRHQGGGSKK